MKADTEPKRLTWDAAGATLSASLYAFASSSYPNLGVADGTANYFLDGAALMKVVALDAPTVVLPAASATAVVTFLRQTPTHLVYEQTASPGAVPSLQSVARRQRRHHRRHPRPVERGAGSVRHRHRRGNDPRQRGCLHRRHRLLRRWQCGERPRRQVAGVGQQRWRDPARPLRLHA